ncbi:ATP-binding protein [Apilactobacillus apisilvae]|uniref:ATP-binding protein n=1 Tax=Apilactobacillus apisilvae TaxID=2923364 RepID=A0ABY4PI98_9LACO|nr:ATP-binding protein [Apilactobacillus apisilvae]UQS85343.1 ATP-binding protein [Apilactobacillus apisilvae]
MTLGYLDTLKAVDIVIKSGHVPNIVGVAGIGKSALVEELSLKNSAKLFTTVVSLSEKGDLSIPVPPLNKESFIDTQKYGVIADVKYGYSHTLIEIIKYAEKNPQQPIYWFLDEFNRGSSGVQSELMNLVLQRQINSLKLPSQVKIIIAENPDSSMDGFEDSDYSVFTSDKAIKDRTTRIVMDANVNDWLKWAKSIKNGQSIINSLVIKYIEENPKFLNIVNDDDMNPTPRSWQRVSDIIDNDKFKDLNYNIKINLIAGNIGEELAASFLNFSKNNLNNLSVSQLINEPLSNIVNKFIQLDELNKNELLEKMIDDIQAWSPDLAQRLNQLLSKLSPDGQYGFMLHVANNTDLINDIYNLTISHEDIEFENLYLQFQSIIFDQFI